MNGYKLSNIYLQLKTADIQNPNANTGSKVINGFQLNTLLIGIFCVCFPANIFINYEWKFIISINY